MIIDFNFFILSLKFMFVFEMQIEYFDNFLADLFLFIELTDEKMIIVWLGLAFFKFDVRLYFL